MSQRLLSDPQAAIASGSNERPFLAESSRWRSGRSKDGYGSTIGLSRPTAATSAFRGKADANDANADMPAAMSAVEGRADVNRGVFGNQSFPVIRTYPRYGSTPSLDRTCKRSLSEGFQRRTELLVGTGAAARDRPCLRPQKWKSPFLRSLV